MQDRALPMLVAFCTNEMRRFGRAHARLQFIEKNARWQFLQFVALLCTFPCFKASHFFFKLAYALNQRRLRLLCGENFFLKFYDRPVASGNIVDVLESLHHIKRGLDSAQASDRFTNHGVSSNAASA
jgi:hypothetical protein